MAKYYIQSGTMKAVISADDTRKAALWAVHRVMQQVLPMDDESRSVEEKSQGLAAQGGVMVLDGRIRLSESGFDRDDAQQICTAEVVTEWNQLMVALSRLEGLL